MKKKKANVNFKLKNCVKYGVYLPKIFLPDQVVASPVKQCLSSALFSSVGLGKGNFCINYEIVIPLHLLYSVI